ncbi:MAG: Gfo/Idh/MocA family protein [Armatimonadota bacterium]
MVGIGIVGTGGIAETHAECLSKIPDVRIAATFDAVHEKAEGMASRYGATVCGDLDSVLAEVDAVYICTPPKFHREAAVRAAEAGVHVLCEKPLAAGLADAQAIEEAVTRADITFMVGFHFRFTPALARLRELVASGDLGEVYSFWGIRILWSPHPAPNWRTDPRLLCGMTVESLSHDFDFMRWTAGEVASVMGKVATSRADLDGYDNIVSAIMNLEAGGIAQMHASWASHVPVHQYGVIGTRGSAVCEGGQVRWRAEPGSAESIIRCDRPEDQVSPYQRQSEHFIACLRSGGQPLTGVQDGVATVRISHAVLESSQQSRVVTLS